MLFKADYSNLNNRSKDFEPLPTGEYEMIIKKAGENATPNGAETFQIDLVVRNDIQENKGYQNRHIFNDNWKRKNDPNAGQYPVDDFQYILMATEVPEGTEMNSMEDFAQAITGKPVRVYVKKEYSDYREEDVNEVAPWNYGKSHYPIVNHTWKDGSPASSPADDDDDDTITINEDDIPF